MAQIIKVFRDPVPAMRFIGKRYAEFGHWGEWFQNGWFDQLEAAMGGVDAICHIWENGGGYVGIERREAGEPFEYRIGMFTPAGTAVPEGFEAWDYEAGAFGTCWIYGRENEVHDTRSCRAAIEAAGMELLTDGTGGLLSFENCLCPRYTAPDDKGNVILDYCYFVK